MKKIRFVARSRRGGFVPFSFTALDMVAIKIKWRFKKGDPDHLPSVPHGHSIDHKPEWVLDVWTGNVVDEGDRKKVLFTIDEKDMKPFRTEKFLKWAYECIEYHKSEFSWQPLHHHGFINKHQLQKSESFPSEFDVEMTIRRPRRTMRLLKTYNGRQKRWMLKK